VKRCLDFGLKTGILLYGPPGLSKTSTALKVMKEFDVIRVRLPNSGYSKVKQLLGYTGSKRIVLIDDADIADNSDKNEVNSELLNFLDSSTYDICIMIMNEVTVLPAIVRPGRMDLKLKCSHPDEALRSRIIAKLLSKYDYPAQDYPTLLQDTDGMTHAEIHNVFKTAIRYNCPLAKALTICKTMESTLKEHIAEHED
jgi:ATP-dependent 26S proteasome regulatory subunit